MSTLNMLFQFCLYFCNTAAPTTEYSCNYHRHHNTLLQISPYNNQTTFIHLCPQKLWSIESYQMQFEWNWMKCIEMKWTFITYVCHHCKTDVGRVLSTFRLFGAFDHKNPTSWPQMSNHRIITHNFPYLWLCNCM